MTFVEFRCYLSEAGDDEVRLWYEAQKPAVRGAILATLQALSGRPRDRWRRKPYGVLRSSTCRGLGEIRIEEPRRMHHRILGFFDGSEAFVLLYAFCKIFDPAYQLACPEAQRRRLDVERDNTRTCEWRF